MPFLIPPFNGNYVRVISTVPSQTELLFTLGLDNEIIGITKFCVHPNSWFRSKKRIGGTKNLNLKLIQNLSPDLIIANKEENEKEQIHFLSKKHDVYVSDVYDLKSALHMIHDIGILGKKENEALKIIEKIQLGFKTLIRPVIQTNVAYLIWKNPFMVAGGETFINDMLAKCGFKNVFESKKRYPEVKIGELKKSGCNLLLLSSEPYPFKERHLKELKAFLPNIKIILVDGEWFSWFGSRLINSPVYFKQLICEINNL